MKQLRIKIGELLATYLPILYVNIQWRRFFGKKMDWENPKDLNEKIQWLKRYTDTSPWTILSDKFKVRDYVKQCGYEANLVKLYGCWKNAWDIEWNSLPKQFVLKVNNGSGDVILCYDKENINKEEIGKKLNNLLSKKFGASTYERHYTKIAPLIIAEELLDKAKQPIVSSSLIDYKIWCFNGTPECIWTCYNRSKKGIEVAVYDLNWVFHPEWSEFSSYYKKASMLLPRPASLTKMLEIASKLSKGFPQVRVDLYEVDGKTYFGEMTFTSDGGLMPYFSQNYLEYLGSKVVLPSRNN